MNAINQALFAADIEEAMNVVELRPRQTELEKHADIHRRAAATYDQRKADAKRACRETIAVLKEERRLLKEKYQADLAALDNREAEARSTADQAVATNERLAAASRAAIIEIER